ncbi:cell envelope biogenesis protein OmpA [Sulfurifustis variabilis]|uniref:Cell envelope biogenesis protein OmpA n=1 Tax=Sulfurifustis variabilis TaxID=1675686 RepID=A0A1B4V4A9_9GAMM|nr:outer membrane beta-barrel protein [Sulfurifustis variabilis]BAU48368.1 cell envelope biogenesis protein OmpA [Sulfurifustis variabilis]
MGWKRTFALAPAVLGWGLPAADEGVPAGGYLGAGMGRAEYGIEGNVADFEQVDAQDRSDDSRTVGRMFAGYRFAPHLAVEATYQSLGTYEVHVEGQGAGDPLALDRTAEADAYSIAALGHYPLSSGSLFARLGAARWRVEATTVTIAAGVPRRQEDDDSGTDLIWGIGWEHRLGSGALRVGYEEIGNVGIDAEEDDLRLIALDVLLRF